MKNEEVVNHLMDIKASIGGIEEHLNNLNSKVATNILKIEENRKVCDSRDQEQTKALSCVKMTLAKSAGALAVIIFAIQVAITYFI